VQLLFLLAYIEFINHLQNAKQKLINFHVNFFMADKKNRSDHSTTAALYP